MADLTQQQDSPSGGMTDLINATKGQALNTGALVQSNQNLATSSASLVTSTNNQVTQTTNLVTQATNQVTQATNLVTQTTNLVTQATNQVTAINSLTTAVTNLTTAINNALSLGAWSTWSPTVTSQTGTITTVGTVVARYAQAGKNVYFSLSITITTNGTGAGAVLATMPLTAKADSIFVGREVNSTGKSLTGTLSAAGSSLQILNYDNTYPAASGYKIDMCGVYEAS
jgi:hypothetical protein